MIPGVLYHGTIPVPYVAMWSSEMGEMFIRSCPIARQPAFFRCGARGEGRPMFGLMSEARQREAVGLRRCQVCNESIAVGRDRVDGYACDVPIGTARGKLPLLNEPLSCERCMRTAIFLCPGIGRQMKRPRFLFARVRYYEQYSVLLRAHTGPESTPELNAALAGYSGPPPVGMIRPALVDYDILSLDQFLTAGADR